MSATLGGLLKDYRLQKNLSQMEIAFSLGWRDASRLSRFEQGRVENPSRELLDRIIELMGLKEEEKNHLLYTGNYLPTKEEIEEVRKKTDPIIQKWPYPAIVLDFSWRIIRQNKTSLILHKIDSKAKKKIEEELLSVIEILFDPNFAHNKYLKEEEFKKWHGWLLEVIIHYKYAQKNRTKEKWYVELIKKMMKNELFRKLWKEAQLTELDQIVTNYGCKFLISPEDKNKRLNFNFFIVPFLKDPRFNIEFFAPSDIETFKYFSRS